MKATFELPDSLYRAIRIRAAREGRKVKDLVAELLDAGMKAPQFKETSKAKPRIGAHPETGLPVIHCSHRATSCEEMTPERMKEILLEQETEWALEAYR